MVTSSQLRAFALSLPGAEEKSHFGKPDFRVRNKIFAGLTEQPERGYFKARPELREELSGTPVGALPSSAVPSSAVPSGSVPSSALAPAEGGWGKSGWTYVELPKIQLAILKELILDSWKLIAPAELVARYEAGAGDVPRRAKPERARKEQAAKPRVSRTKPSRRSSAR